MNETNEMEEEVVSHFLAQFLSWKVGKFLGNALQENFAFSGESVASTFKLQYQRPMANPDFSMTP